MSVSVSIIPSDKGFTVTADEIGPDLSVLRISNGISGENLTLFFDNMSQAFDFGCDVVNAVSEIIFPADR